jgi:hypothetical protein
VPVTDFVETLSDSANAAYWKVGTRRRDTFHVVFNLAIWPVVVTVNALCALFVLPTKFATVVATAQFVLSRKVAKRLADVHFKGLTEVIEQCLAATLICVSRRNHEPE